MPKGAKIFIAVLVVLAILGGLYVPGFIDCSKIKNFKYADTKLEPYPFEKTTVPDDFVEYNLFGVSFKAPYDMEASLLNILFSESTGFTMTVNEAGKKSYIATGKNPDKEIKFVTGKKTANLYERTHAIMSLDKDKLKPYIPFNPKAYRTLANKKSFRIEHFVSGYAENVYEFSNDDFKGYIFYYENEAAFSTENKYNAGLYLYPKSSGYDEEQIFYLSSNDKDILGAVINSFKASAE